MKAVFDLQFDSGCWPGPLGSGRTAVAGEAWVGPRGLLGMLEISLGLCGLPVAEAERTAALVPKLLKKPGFWTESANVDALNTARELLALREALCVGGWRGQKLEGQLGALAEVTSEVPPGVSERLAECITRLRTRAVDIQEVALFDARSELPPLWREALVVLEDQGSVIVDRAAPCTVSDLKSDLYRRRGSPVDQTFEAAGDGSLQLVRPAAPLEAADEVAAWIAALPPDERARTVIICPDSLLDAALQQHGVPCTGTCAAGENAVLELLPLVLASGWDPPDPQRVLELLTLPDSPVPQGVACSLLEALREWPAVGSDSWSTCIDKGLAKIGDLELRETVQQRLEVLFGPEARAYPDRTFPVKRIGARVKMLSSWLTARRGAEEDEWRVGSWQSAIAQCRTFSRLVDLSGFADFVEPQLRSFVEEATACAPTFPLRSAEAGIWCVNAPGAVAEPAAHIVWWNFTLETVEPVRRYPFSRAELDALAKQGVSIESAGTRAAATARTWRRPLHMAEKSLVLVAPHRGRGGELASVHPFWEHVRARVANPRKLECRQPACLADQSISRTQLTFASPPEIRDNWIVPGELLHLGEKVSPSSLDTLVGCPFKFVAEKTAYLRRGQSGYIADISDPALRGSIVHAILETLLKEHGGLAPAAASEKAVELFEANGPFMAAGFFMPGATAARAKLNQVLRSSVDLLFRLVQNGGYEIEFAEQEQVCSAFGSSFAGRPDLVLRTKGGDDSDRRIIDFKSGSTSWKLGMLRAGTATQLASYSRILDGSNASIPGAYFMLETGRILTTTPDAFTPGAVEGVNGPQLTETWHGFETAVGNRLDELAAGRILAPEPEAADKVKYGVLADGTLRLQPPCGLCDLGGLCGRGLEESK